MRTSKIISLCSLLLASLFLFDIDAQTLENTPYIEVTGKAERDIVPDEIYLSISLSESDYGKESSLIAKEKQVLKTLENIGIDIQKQLSVKDLGSNFKKYVLRKNEVILSKDYELKTASAKQAAQVMMALEAIGVSKVTVDKVDCSQTEKYRDELRVEAIKNAKQKAEQLCQAIGQTCGKAIYIVEQNYGHRVYNAMPMFKASLARAESADVASVPELAFESITLESSILVRFSLE
ncbi:MAG: SIMPL domain-containing protein [Bacteroidales bacterium]|nr:SIMPL domain-containing protein [Bacteroidales bacterium]